MAIHVVFIFAFCFVSMATGKGIANTTTQNYEQCLTNLQCRTGTTQRVVVDNTTYCCQESQKLSITTGADKVLMRMSQTLGRMFYNTVMKNTFPGYVSSDSTKSKSSESSESDSDDSFSDSESMDSRSVQDSKGSLEFMDSRDIWEYLEDLAGIDNVRLNTRRLRDELLAVVSRSSNTGEVPMDKRVEMGSLGGRDINSEKRDFSKAINERAIINEEKARVGSLKTTRRGSDMDRLVRKRFRTERNVAMNGKRRSGPDAWTDAIYYLLKKNYIGDNEETVRQDTDGGNIIEKDEAQIPAAVVADIFKRDAGFNSENEDNQRLNRALGTLNSPDVETRFDRQGDTNDVANRDKRQNENPKPAVGTAPTKETSSKVPGAQNTQTAGKISDPKVNPTNTTKPSGGTQTGGPPPTAADKKNRYVLCKCLPGK